MGNKTFFLKYKRSLEKLFSFPIIQRIGRSKIALIIGLVLIVAWQSSFIASRNSLSDKYANRAASAISFEKKFVYFYYYLGLFPVATEMEKLDYSREGAEKLAQENGSALLTEYKSTIRWGDWGQMYLYLPYAYWKGSPEYLDLRPATAGFFVFSLLLLYAAFWRCRLTVPGAILVLFAGSNPFQLFEAFRNENVFSISISLFLLTLAVNLPFIFNKRMTLLNMIVRVCLTAFLIAFLQQMRTGVQILLVSAAFIYLISERLLFWRRIILVFALFLCYWGALNMFKSYFLYKFQQADKFVAEHHGHVYTGPRDFTHRIWHSVFMGFSDFDKNFYWDDRFGVLCVLPYLEEVNNVKYPPYGVNGQWGFDDFYYDEAKKFPVEGQQLPNYSAVMKKITLSIIKENPLWYVEILSSRLWRFILQTTPLRVAFGKYYATIPFSGIFVVPLMFIFLWLKNRKLAVLLMASFPLAGTMILVYSGKGTPYYNCYHLICAALIACFAIEAGLRFCVKRRTKRAGHS